MPEEGATHECTWMAWPNSKPIWGNLLRGVQRDIGLIAKTIAKYEPVHICTDHLSSTGTRISECCGDSATIFEGIPSNDCWMRDIGPLFGWGIHRNLIAVDCNFNGWGCKQRHDKDKFVARRIAERTATDCLRAGIVFEPGAVEWDGDGTLLATESSILHTNRNGCKDRAAIESELLRLYGASKLIWFPGVAGEDITDGHVDACTRFARPGVILMHLAPPEDESPAGRDSREQFDILTRSTDARGRTFEIIIMPEPPAPQHISASRMLLSYLNFYICNGAVVTAAFGDPEVDELARQKLSSAFPDRVIEMLRLDSLYRGGGGVHCVTQQQPQQLPPEVLLT